MSRASPTVLGMWSCTVKLDEEYPTYAVWPRKMVLAERMLAWLVKGASALCPWRKECNKYDLTAARCFWLAHHNDCSRWFAISPPPVCCPHFSFMGDVAKQYITKLGCEIYFRRVTYWALLEMLMSFFFQYVIKQDLKNHIKPFRSVFKWAPILGLFKNPLYLLNPLGFHGKLGFGNDVIRYNNKGYVTLWPCHLH